MKEASAGKFVSAAVEIATTPKIAVAILARRIQSPNDAERLMANTPPQKTFIPVEPGI
jgi:hypothetical protein